MQVRKLLHELEIQRIAQDVTLKSCCWICTMTICQQQAEAGCCTLCACDAPLTIVNEVLIDPNCRGCYNFQGPTCELTGRIPT